MISFTSQLLFATSFVFYPLSRYRAYKLHSYIFNITLKLLHNVCIIISFYFLQKDVPFIPQIAKGKEKIQQGIQLLKVPLDRPEVD